eukprot:1160687-Pelagomonas_calceolata.AAC.2
MGAPPAGECSCERIALIVHEDAGGRKEGRKETSRRPPKHVPWAGAKKEDLGEDVPNSAKDVRIMVNWLHASSHDLSCQILNSGRFMDGTGWVVGEQIEQLWSLLKDAAGLMRCMTKQNRHDFLELLLSDVFL